MAIGGRVIGIDLGTTNSVVAVMDGGEPTVIPNAEGNRVTPSVVGFADEDEVLVGEPARRQSVTNPRRTVYSIKRFMGRRGDEVIQEQELVPYEVISGDEEYVSVRIDDKQFTPQEISAIILRKLKESAEEYLGERVVSAVITVPAYFNDAQRQATKDAGKIAGLKVERIINEPTAASLAYGMDKRTQGKIAIFDLGGGTFDISILEIADEVFHVNSTNGDTHLGGDDFDFELVNFVASEFKRDQGIDLRNDEMALQRLQEACEKAKRELSSANSTTINLPFITADSAGPKHLTLTITRAEFESLVDHLVERCREPVMQALADADLGPDDIDDVVLVGGATRMPRVQEFVEEIFGRKPTKSVNPDEVVALGAAIQGAVLTGEVGDIVLLDVTPLSLGIETKGGIMAPLVERNSSIPTERKQVFTTVDDNQTVVTLRIYQGESELTEHNRLLGHFKLEGIPAAPVGVPKIEVMFDIDVNGILHVGARDIGTGVEQSVRIEQSSGLSASGIQRLRTAAEASSADSRKKRDLIDARNKCEKACFQSEKVLREYTDQIGRDDRDAMAQVIEQTRNTARTGTYAEILAATDGLEKGTSALMQSICDDISLNIGNRVSDRARRNSESARKPQPNAETGSQRADDSDEAD